MPFDLSKPRRRVLATLGLVLFLTLTAALIFTRTPWWDESDYADPAYNLTVHGKLASTVLLASGHPHIRTIVAYDKYTYWTVPLYLITLAGWFKVVGFSIFKARFYSVLWGVALLWAVYTIAARLTRKSAIGILAGFIAATDYTIVMGCTNARMDSMGASLGFCGIACYLVFREKRLHLALLLGATGAACSALTHLVGVLHTLGLLVTILFLDRTRLRFNAVTYFVLPYLIVAAGWGLYIAQAPSIFLQQITATTSYRVGGAASPLSSILVDFVSRYVFYFSAQSQSGVARLKVLILVAYVSALLLAVAIPRLRRSPGVLLTVTLCFAYYCGLAVIDHLRFPQYVIHVIPLFTILLALVISWFWNGTPARSSLLTAILCAFVLLQVGGLVMQARKDSYTNDYLPVVRFVETHARPGSTIMGSSELFFALEPQYRVIDDTRLGFLSHVKPDMIVAGNFYPDAEYFRRAGEADVAEHVDYLLTHDYHRIATLGAYRIYTPVGSPPSQ